MCIRDSRSLEQIEFMLNKIIENEGEPDIVQISGGEPTIHPDFFKILDLCKSRPCLLYTSPSPRDRTRSRMPSSA